MVVGRGEAGALAHRTVDIDDRGAVPADEMVVVVAHAGFVAGNGPQGLDPAHQPGVRQRAQDVVDRLMGHPRQLGPSGNDQALGVGVRMVVNSRQHGQSRLGDPQPGIAQRAGHLRVSGHSATIHRYLEPVKISRLSSFPDAQLGYR